MMTRREAQQRAAVYGAHIYTQVHHKTGLVRYAAQLDTWSRQDKLSRNVWRDDIEDAVLDCGRLKP